MKHTTRTLIGAAGLLSALSVTEATGGDGLRPAGASDRGEDAQAVLRRLPERELKAFYRRCSRSALEARLASNEIAVCSIGYEILLQREFGGDFLALHAWSKDEPGPGED